MRKAVREQAGLRSQRLADAFARVRREDFLGPGPWQIARGGATRRGYEWTPDADPRHLYELVLVAIDAARGLNNGDPPSLARWFDLLEIGAGDRVAHVGCGVGYYTAILAEVVGAAGRVVGVEIDADLAARAAVESGAVGLGGGACRRWL